MTTLTKQGLITATSDEITAVNDTVAEEREREAAGETVSDKIKDPAGRIAALQNRTTWLENYPTED